MEIIISILTLTLMEIVLGIDNVIFISLVLEDLDEKTRKVMRIIGLGFAFVARVVLLCLINHISHLDKNALFSIGTFDITWHNIVMLVGGGFLIYKSISEIHENYAALDHAESTSKRSVKRAMFYIVLQIVAIDIVFSFDSILTAIGLADQIFVMIIAVILSMLIMLFFSEFVNRMIDRYPTVKNLALCFLILVGFVLILDGFHFEVQKGIVYIVIAFGLLVEIINLTMFNRNKSNHQVKTEVDFNHFVLDYDQMDETEKRDTRTRILTWIEQEHKKSSSSK